jgi:hypothetical protein
MKAASDLLHVSRRKQERKWYRIAFAVFFHDDSAVYWK